jgi:metal-dependent hydrolase (beta-lactamase superfamily II)
VSEVKFNNRIFVTVLCHNHPDDHHFGFEYVAPSEALHRAMVDVPCSGNFTVSMTVIEVEYVS